SRNPADFKAYLTRFPKGVFIDLAQNRLAALEQEGASKLPGVAPPGSSLAPLSMPPPQSPAPVPPSSNSNPASGLIERARALITAGDISAARLLLRRAYDRGDPRAALELGGTYDPLVLRRLNISVVNFYADAAQASDWYRKAAEAGSTDAIQRMKD